MNDPQNKQSAWLGDMPPAVWLAALVLGAAFFVSEHDIHLSQAVNFAETADEMLATAEGGNPFRRAAFITLAALGIALFALAHRTPSRGTFLGCCIYALTALAFASVLWADDPALCIRRLLVLGMALTAALGIARRFNLRELCWLALLVSGSCVLIGVGCEIVLGTFQPWTGDYRFSGTLHPNTQGAYLATLCLSSLCLFISEPPRRRLFGAVLVMGLVLLVLTKSRTSTAGVLLAGSTIVLLLCTPRTRLVVPALGVMLGAVAFIALLWSGSYGDRVLSKVAFLGREEETESFSGRTTIWPVVQTYIDRQYWFGYGYESFWTPAHIEAVTAECEWPVREAHSAYLDLWLSLGAVGCAAYVTLAIVGLAFTFAHYQRQRDAAALFWFGLLLYGLINGAFESGMMMISFPTLVIATGLFRLAFFPRPAADTVGEVWAVRPYTPLNLGAQV